MVPEASGGGPLVRGRRDAWAGGRPDLPVPGRGPPRRSWKLRAYLVIGGTLDGWVSEGGSSYLWDSIRRGADELAERDGMREIWPWAMPSGRGSEAQGGTESSAWSRCARPSSRSTWGHRPPDTPTHIMQDLAAAGEGSPVRDLPGGIERAFDRMATGCDGRPVRSLVRDRSGRLSAGVDLRGARGGSDRAARCGRGRRARVGHVREHDQEAWGATRIAVAKDALTGLVQSTLPEGLPVALRTFKAGKRSCDSTLLVGLEPLERAAMSRLSSG